MRLPSVHDRDSLELKMTPMIDVVFLLLVFFVWTSSFELPEFDLPSAIAEPPAGGSETSIQQAPTQDAFDEIIVRVLYHDSSTVIQFNGQICHDIATLKQRVAEVISLDVQPPVIVNPEDQVKMNVAVEVYDAIRAAGADRVLFAVSPEPQAG